MIHGRSLSRNAVVAKPELFVASVYSPSTHHAQWLALQARWLRRSLQGSSYRFGIVLNGVDAPMAEEGIEVIAACPRNMGHAEGLAMALDWVRAGDARFALLLDSDAFPIKSGWFPRLADQMARFGKRIAAPVRFENLDRFPHPCAMLLERGVIDEPWFSLRDGIEATNLLGDVIRDVGACMVDRHDEVLPLLRSNAVNLHPVAAALYHDCFYHHGAGSRDFRFRVIDRYAYLDGWPANGPTPEALTEALFANPRAFIEGLRGDALPPDDA
jgi:hypothetical protein